MIEAQGRRFVDPLPVAPAHPIEADASGWLTALDGSALGHAIVAMGGGRREQQDRLDWSVGLEMLVRLGEPVQTGQPLVRVFCQGSGTEREAVLRQVRSALTIGPEPTVAPPLIVNH